MDCLAGHVARLQEIELLAETAARALDARTPQGRTEGNAIARSALVLLCGYFEGFIRELLEEAIDEINDAGINVDSLPPPLLCGEIEELTNSFRKRQSPDLSSLISLLRSERKARVAKGKLNKTAGNPTVETIEALFENFGLADVIDGLSVRDYEIDSTYILESQVNVAMRDQLQEALGSDNPALESVISVIERKWLARKKRRSVGYVSEINELLKKRNRIAHGEGQEPVTPEDLLSAKKMVEKLSLGLHGLIEAKLQTLVPAT